MTVRVTVRLTPRGGRDAVEGVGEDGAIRCRVAAAPVDGGANEALVRLLAAELGIPRSGVRIAVGASARSKVVALAGVTAEDLVARWPGVRPRV